MTMTIEPVSTIILVVCKKLIPLVIKGVGWVTAAWTLVTTLNFSSCDTVDSLTAYAGLAPMPRQSGASVWHRPSIGRTGNGRLRTAFYTAT